MRTLVHLVRHAEVENPGNVWYGRLEGFHISNRGLRQARALGRHFSVRDLAAVYSSPLTRAMETATEIAAPHRLDVKEDDDLIESETRLQGRPADLRMFVKPWRLRHFINPYRPSWGEPYASIRSRMVRAVEGIRDCHPGREAVAVSHMTPVLVARLAFEGDGRPPWRAGKLCRRASVTTIVFDDDEVAGVEYDSVGSVVD